MSSRILCGLLLLLFLKPAAADSTFVPHNWSRGLHLLAGGGVNTSYYSNLKYEGKIGLGLNFKTDLGYFLSDKWAVELSSTVKFNKLQDNLIWDTLFTLGLRYRIDDWFVRAFYGRAPTVFYSINRKAPLQFRNRDVERLQYDGPVMGVGVGKMFLSEGGRTWYLEVTATYQHLEKVDVIGMEGETPVVIDSMRQNDTRILGLIGSIGVLVF